MDAVFNMIINQVRGWFNCLSAIEFTMFGYRVNFLGILFAFIILSFVISVFWKGAKG